MRARAIVTASAIASLSVLSLVSAAPSPGAGAPPAAASSPAPAGGFPLSWPAPEGWRTETIPFPLDFAPTLSYHGVEELRFSPGFGKPERPDYFTYAFVWWINEAEVPALATLEKEFKVYFDGLMHEVAASKNLGIPRVDSRVRALPPKRSAKRRVPPGFQFIGTLKVETVDAFFTAKALSLEMAVFRVDTTVSGKALIYFEVSPQLSQTAVDASFQDLRTRLPQARR